MLDPVDRCIAFLDAMQELCLVHRIEIVVEDSLDFGAVEFHEKSNDPTGNGFVSDIVDIADIVNRQCFDELNGMPGNARVNEAAAGDLNS